MLRIADQKDFIFLHDLLREHSMRDDDMAFNNCATWIIDENKIKGFLSLRMEHAIPYLVHLCIKYEERTPELFWRLATYFKNIVKSLGYNKAIINTPKDNLYLIRLVSRYFNVRPYAEDNQLKFYLVEV